MSASADHVQAFLVNNTFIIDNLTNIDFNNSYEVKPDLFTEPFEELWKKLLGTRLCRAPALSGAPRYHPPRKFRVT
mgnify:CR=1 FL=1